MNSETYVFRSSLFAVEPGEDEDVNPRVYGRALGHWMAERLREVGYTTDVIPEDWGWCVICEDRDDLLWVGCSGFDEHEPTEEDLESGAVPEPLDVTWPAFPVIEVPFFRPGALFRRFSGRLDTATPLECLDAAVREILEDEPQIEAKEGVDRSATSEDGAEPAR